MFPKCNTLFGSLEHQNTDHIFLFHSCFCANVAYEMPIWIALNLDTLTYILDIRYIY